MSRRKTFLWEQLDITQGKTQQTTINIKNNSSRSSREKSRTGIDRFQIEEMNHMELELEQKMHNRIKFLQMDRERHRRTLQLAKNKYEKLLEIRNQTMKEKQQCRKRKEDMNQRINRDITTRAERIRSQKKRITVSIQKIRQKHQSDAKSIRSLSVENQQSLKNSRRKETEHKRQLVEKVHSDMQQTRTFLLKRHQDQEQKGKAEHQAYLEEKLRLNNVRKRKNSLLKQKLHESLMNASKERQQCMSELKQYTSMIREKTHHPGIKAYQSTQTTIS